MLINIQCVPDEKDSSKHEYIVYCFEDESLLHQKKNTAYTALKTKSRNFYDLFVCFFGFIVPLENCSLIWRRHHYRWRATNFDIILAVMPIEQWEFFRVSHLLWHVASIYNDNDHLRGPLTLTLIAKRSAVGLSLLFLRTCVCDGWDSNIQRFACEANALTYCATTAVKLALNLIWCNYLNVYHVTIIVQLFYF